MAKEIENMEVTAPVRIDISAGWPDSDPYRRDFGGSVLNAAINLRTCGRLGKDKNTSYGDAAGHQGLGGSGAVHAIDVVLENPELINVKMALMRKVWMLENKIYERRGGLQDQAAAIYGGVNLWEFGPGPGEEVSIRRTEIPEENAEHLEERLVLVDTGESHLSSDIHKLVFGPGNYERNIPKLDRMGEIAHEMYDVLMSNAKVGFPDERENIMAALMAETWLLQRSLHKSIETDRMRDLQEAGKQYSSDWRATGAGGGGCMIFYVAPNLKPYLIESLEEVDGAEILPFKFDYGGLEIEEE